MKPRPRVLLVEGKENDELRALRVITDSEIDCDVRVARDGIEASGILFESEDQAPTLILLDLDLPKLNGFELLARIRGNDKTKRLTVIVFSDSGEQSEVNKCFDLHANSYVQKDKDLDYYETRLKLMLYYWIAVNRNVNT
jgi:CheY-like chemotaxis protein